MISDICAPTDAVLERIIDDIETADAEELLAACPGKCLKQILEESRATSYECFGSVKDGELLGLFGISCNSHEGEVGIPWAVFTITGRKHRRTVLETSRHLVSRWQTLHECLTNIVDVRNARAIRWLTWLGFEFIDEFPIGDTTFKQFFWSTHNV
jgi:hypothetical protein